jgi:hypothetical protein
MQFFANKKIIQPGKGDPLISYLYSKGTHRLTPFGNALYQYLRADEGRIPELKEGLDEVRKLGENNESRAKAMAKAVQDVRRGYGNLSEASDKDAFMLGAEINAIITGVRSAGGQGDSQILFDDGNQLIVTDREGVRQRVSKTMVCRDNSWGANHPDLEMSSQKYAEFKKLHSGDMYLWTCNPGTDGVVLYYRDLKRQQEKMNANRPPCAPRIPETGRYNFETFYYSYCQQEMQAKQMEESWHLDRKVHLAQLLGKQIQGDQYYSDPGLEDDLVREARKKKLGGSEGEYFSTCDRRVHDFLEMTDCMLEKRKEYSAKALEYLKSYQAHVMETKGKDVVSRAEVERLDAERNLVNKYVILAYTDAQSFQAISQLETIGFETSAKDGMLRLLAVSTAPAAAQFFKALEESGLDDARKERYRRAALPLAQRYLRLVLVFRKLLEEAQAADPATGMDSVESALQSMEKQLGDLRLDLNLYLSAVPLSKIFSTEGRGLTPALTRWGCAAASWATGGRIGSRYLENRGIMERYGPRFKQTLESLMAADFQGARALLLDLEKSDPFASFFYRDVGISGDKEMNDAEKISAVLKKAQSLLGEVADLHVKTGIAVNLIKWSAALAVFAPAASWALTGVAKVCATAAKVAEGLGRAGKVAAYLLRGVGAVAEHSAIRLSSLNPTADKLYASTQAMRALEATMVRFVNAGVRLSAFALGLSGNLSGIMTAGMHGWQQTAGDGHSPFRSAWVAYGMGYQGGAKWATESWHPAILYAGIPSTSFEGTPFAAVTESAAMRGLVGNASAAVEAGLRKAGWEWGAKMLGKASLAGLMQSGAAGKALGTIAAMGDNVGKFYMIGIASRGIGKWGSYRLNTVDGENVDRRVRRAEAAGLSAMELPLWLFMPQYPARYEVNAKAFQRSEQGYKEYEKAGELDKIANAAADTAELPLKTKPQTPAMELIFNFHWRGAAGEHGTFRVSKDMKYKAIAEELPGSLTGATGGAKVDPLSVNPLEYFRVSQMADNEKIGRLYVNDEVRDQAQGLFERAILKNASLAEGILKATPGKALAGFGTVSPQHQEEVARILFRAGKAGDSVPRSAVDASKALLRPYLDSEEAVSTKAKDLWKALKENSRPSARFKGLVESMLQRTQDWTAAQDVKGHPERGKPYTDLFSEFRQNLDAAKASLSAKETAVVAKSIEYLEAIQNRFQYFNRQETFQTRVQKGMEALSTEYSGGPKPDAKVEAALQDFLKTTLEWSAKNRAPGQEVMRSHEPSLKPDQIQPSDFGGLLKDLSGRMDALKGEVSAKDYAVLERAYKQIQSAPWMLHDSKGGNFFGWRPVQFEGMMYFLYSITKGGAEASQVVRTFLMMKTGAGKTLIAFEGLLPFADADAAASGKKTMFLTVQSNLESQARMEFRSLKKLATNMTLDTWEGFKTKIAEGKLKFQNKTDDFWILGDEMDGAALQPALTIGETTALVGKESQGYRKLKGIGDRLESMLDRGPVDRQKQLDDKVLALKSAAEGLPEGGVKEGLLKSVKDLMRASRELEVQETRVFEPSANKGRALERAAGWLRRGGGNALPGPESEALRGLASELKAAKGPAAEEALMRLDSKLKELHNSQLSQDIASAERRIGRLLGRQGEFLSQLPQGSPASDNVLSAREGIQRFLSSGRGGVKGTPAPEFLEQLDDLIGQQKSVLAQTEASGQRTAERLLDMARKAKSEGRAGEAKEFRAQAKEMLEQGERARSLLKANIKSIRTEASRGRPGWELRVRELLSERGPLVDAAVAKENPVYEIMARMRQDMYSMVRSTLRQQDDALTLQQSPKKAAQALLERGRDLVESLEALASKDSGAKPLLEEARKVQGRWEEKAAEISKMLEKPVNAKHQALMLARESAHEALGAAQAELKTARAEFSAADASARAAKQQAVKAALARVDELSGKYEGINAQLKPFQEPQRQAVLAEIKGLLEQSRELSGAWGKSLSGYSGPEAAAARHALRTMPALWESQVRRLEWTSDRAVEVWQRRIEGPPLSELVLREGLKWTGLRWALSKVPALKGAELLRPLTETSPGLSRMYARQLVRAFVKDPFLSPEVRWRMFWEIVPSTLFPRGLSGKGSGWVHTELYNLARGYFDTPANVRIDNITGRINVIHNGQWFESMDTPTRRYWELEYGTDLTLPYEHKTMVTMNDLIRDNHNFSFVGFSGTTGNKFYSYMSGNKVDIVGKGSTGAPSVDLELHGGSGGSMQSIGDAVRLAKSNMTVTLGEPSGAKSLRERLLASPELGLKPGEVSLYNREGKSILAFDLPDPVRVQAVERFLRQGDLAPPGSISAMNPRENLVVLSLSDTRMVKAVRHYLLKTGLLEPDNIAMVFSDTEYLRLQRPQAEVSRQMNLDGLTGGKVKVLMLDTRVGGRGLDLNFKGVRGGADANAFRGYNRFDMLIVDPQEMSGVHNIQAQGRIDLGRVNPGAERSFRLVMDIETAQRDPVFVKMMKEEPVMRQLAEDPGAVAVAMRQRKFSPDWASVHEFVQDMEARGANPKLCEQYRQAVSKYLSSKQDVVELEQLRSAAIIHDSSPYLNLKLRGLEGGGH